MRVILYVTQLCRETSGTPSPVGRHYQPSSPCLSDLSDMGKRLKLWLPTSFSAGDDPLLGTPGLAHHAEEKILWPRHERFQKKQVVPGTARRRITSSGL